MGGEKTDPSTGLGLYQKYQVKRLNDPNRKHDNCQYFVLDLTHDPYAIPALAAYAEACEAQYANLAKDLREIIASKSMGLKDSEG
jgi:hypothetical protein